MASGKYLSVNVLLFCILFQNDILIIAANTNSNCVNPKFEENQKVKVQYYFTAGIKGIAKDLCHVIRDSNGLLSVEFHPCGDHKDTAICLQDDNCIQNRFWACYYKLHADIFNDCTKELPNWDPAVFDCVCAGSADEILTSNETARKGFGIQNLPALVVDNKFDPCFTNYSYDSMKKYFCTAYKNKNPALCGKSN